MSREAIDELKRVQAAEREAKLDDLLSRWWYSQPSMQTARGHGRAAVGFESYQASRQYDDSNGSLDDAIEAGIMRQVGHEIMQLGDPWRSAISAIARSLCTGAAVFHSPRIPPQDRARVTAEAREKLIVRLVAAGVM